MAVPKGCCVTGCAKKILITALIVVVLVVVAGVIIANLTLDKIGVADLEIGGTTIRELGFADVKLWTFVKTLNAIRKPKVDKIVTNPLEEADKASAAATLASAGVPQLEGGGLDYVSLLENPIVGEARKKLVFTDRELAGIINGIITQGKTVDDEAINKLKDLDAAVVQVEMKEGKVAILMKIDLEGIIDLGPLNFLMPDVLYFNSISSASVANDGSLVLAPAGLEINGISNDLANKIFAALIEKSGESAGDKTPSDYVNEVVGEAFKSIVWNIGQLGTANVLPDGSLADISIGTQYAISYKTSSDRDSTVTLITRLAADQGTEE